jgi:hypothetical protein
VSLPTVDALLNFDHVRVDRSTERRHAAGWDVLALLRCADLVGVVPALRRRSRAYLVEYEVVVGPIVASTLGTSGPTKYLNGSMRETCVKACIMLAAHAATANAVFRPDVAILGSAFTRVYDDLFDDDGSDGLMQRISALFQGGGFTPTTPVEALFYRLYRELERRIVHQRDDPIYPALIALHDAQTRSRGQRDPAVTCSDLAEVTLAKGRHGGVVLFGLMLPGMRDEEVAVARAVGAIIQLVDDYQDVAADRRAGISTLATRGQLSMRLICHLLRGVMPAVQDCYGRHQPLLCVMYLYLWLGFGRRRLPAVFTSTGRMNVVTSLVRNPVRS